LKEIDFHSMVLE